MDGRYWIICDENKFDFLCQWHASPNIHGNMRHFQRFSIVLNAHRAFGRLLPFRRYREDSANFDWSKVHFTYSQLNWRRTYQRTGAKFAQVASLCAVRAPSASVLITGHRLNSFSPRAALRVQLSSTVDSVMRLWKVNCHYVVLWNVSSHVPVAEYSHRSLDVAGVQVDLNLVAVPLVFSPSQLQSVQPLETLLPVWYPFSCSK